MIALLARLRRIRAERALAAGRDGAALRLYRRLAQSRRASADDRLRCVDLLERSGAGADAIRLLEDWLRESPEPALRQRLATALIRAGRHEAAARLWAGLVHEGAAPPEALLQLGAAIAAQGGTAQAEGMFSDSFHGAEDPAIRRAAWRHYAAMAEQEGRHETALERWRLLAAFAPLEPEDWRHVGTLAARLGEQETVAEATTHLADPDDRAALRQLLAESRQDWTAAREAAAERLARALPAQAPELRRSLLRYAVRDGDDRGAVRAFFALRRRDAGAVGGEPTAVMQAAQALKRLAKPALAEALLRAHLARRTVCDPRLYLLLAEIRLTRHDPAGAAALLERTAPEEPALAARRERLRGHVAAARGQPAEAACRFRRANRAGPATEATLLREVEAWRAAGAPRERSLALRRALARLPGSLPLARQAALFAEEQEDWQSAARAWGHCAERHPQAAEPALRHALALLEAGRPYHFLSLAERIAADGPMAAAPGGEETFDARLVAAYRRLLHDPGGDHAAELPALAGLVGGARDRDTLARFRLRAERAAALHAPKRRALPAPRAGAPGPAPDTA